LWLTAPPDWLAATWVVHWFSLRARRSRSRTPYGQTGFLIPPGDVAEMAAAVVRLHDDPVLRQSMGIAGRRDVVNHFDVERMLDGHADSMLSRTRSQRRRQELIR